MNLSQIMSNYPPQEDALQPINNQEFIVPATHSSLIDRPFECETCKKRFTQKSHLKTHYRTHTQEKPYQCKFCPKKFSQSGNLRTHYRIHTGEKPFICEFCSKGFSQKAPLKAHVRTHTGEK